MGKPILRADEATRIIRAYILPNKGKNGHLLQWNVS